MASSIYDSGVSNVKNAASTGQSAVNSFDPTAFGANTQNTYSGILGGQQGQQADYIQNFKDTIANQPNLATTYDTLNKQYNVPTLASNANYLQGQVLNAPQRNLQMAKGFNYDQNQVDKATNLDLARLSPLAQNATNQLQTAEGLVNSGVGYQQTQNQYELQPLQTEGQMLGDFWARQASGFTTIAQSTLEGLTAKMQAGEKLSEAEMAQYAQLAGQEAQYQSALNSANAGVTAAKIGAQNQIIAPGSTYFNPATGQYYNPYANVNKP